MKEEKIKFICEKTNSINPITGEDDGEVWEVKRHKGQKEKMFTTLSKNKGREVVKYYCPQCGSSNEHLWFGRENHFCINCGLSSNIKGTRLVN